MENNPKEEENIIRSWEAEKFSAIFLCSHRPLLCAATNHQHPSPPTDHHHHLCHHHAHVKY